MDRRKVLIGSGTAFATILAGCASSSDQESETHSDDGNADKNDTKDDKKDEKNDDKKGEKDDGKDEKKKKGEIPGFDRDDFHLDSDVIQVKDITYQKQKLDIRVMLMTDDRDELIEELRALAPGLEDAVRDAEVFLAHLEELKFTLLDEDKNRVFAFFLDVAWLREFLNGEMTNDELVDRLHDAMEQV